MKILIDFLSISFKYDNVGNLYEQLGLIGCNFQPLRLRHYMHGEYYCGIVIGYNTDDIGVVTDTFLDISGTGCRAIEQINSENFDWFEFLHQYDNDIHDHKCNISRIDVACDLLDNEIPMNTFFRYSRNYLYVCRAKCKPDIRMERTENIYFGSEHSNRILRIYNKSLQMGIPDTYWIRMEFQLRNECAISFYLNWCNYRNDIGKLYSGMMIDFLRFVDVPRGIKIADIKNNRNQGRLSTAPWWQRIIGDANRIPQMYLPGEKFTLERVENYIRRNTFSSWKTYLIAHDGDITKLLDGVKNVKLNFRQQQLINEIEMNLKIFKSDLEK